MTPKQLKEARQKLGLTQKAMAERLNTPKSSYLKWEQGSRRVPGIIEAFLKLL